MNIRTLLYLHQLRVPDAGDQTSSIEAIYSLNELAPPQVSAPVKEQFRPSWAKLSRLALSEPRVI